MHSGKFSGDWQASTIGLDARIRDALAAIAGSGVFMACVVDADGVLLAIVTDSDIRRAMLHGAELDGHALPWANRQPIVGGEQWSVPDLLHLAKSRGVREIPLTDEAGRLQDIFVLSLHEQRGANVKRCDAKTNRPKLPNTMFILAGGLGTRLRSVVSDRPKPLALIGNKPILETLIMQAASYGVESFFVSVNYLGDQIEQHLAKDIYDSLSIAVVWEKARLGTAGSIGYIKDKVQHPLLVANSDVLTTVPFDKIIAHHLGTGAELTCVVRKHLVHVPFGVVHTDDGLITGMEEKPEYSYFVNTGIYVVSPELCRMIEPDKYLDMPDLVSLALRLGRKVVPFLMHEYWIDVGRPEDFHRANVEYDNHFGNQSP